MLNPILFLKYINEITQTLAARTVLRLSADDSLLCRLIKSPKNQREEDRGC